MAETNLSDILSEIGPLAIETMNYELKLRGVQPAQAPTTKKVQLAREIMKERQGEGASWQPVMTLSNDLRSIASLFARFESTLTNTNHTRQSIDSAMINFVFLKIRAERLNPISLNDISTANMLITNIDNAIRKTQAILSADNFMAESEIVDLVGNHQPAQQSSDQFNIDPLFASLNLNAPNEFSEARPAPQNNVFFQENHNQNPSANSVFNTQSQFNRNVPLSSTYVNPNMHMNFGQFNPSAEIENVQHEMHLNPPSNIVGNGRPQFHQNFHSNQNHNTSTQFRRDHKIYKWKIKFTGEDSKYDAIDFIQKVNATAQSRGVTESELFESAIDFFSGQALKWYYAQRTQTKTWAELSDKLISDFIEVNYYDNLLDTIRQRKQTSTESIVHFFTIFEDDCSRLQTRMSPSDQIHIIKKNVLQKYRPHISLKYYESLNDLKHDLKLLEASMAASNDRTVGFHNNTNTRSSRYDSFRGNRSYSRSPSNSSNATRSNQPPSQFHSNRPATPIPNNINRNASNDRAEKRNKSPYDEKRRSDSFDRNKNNTRSNSRDSNSSQRNYKPQKNLNN